MKLENKKINKPLFCIFKLFGNEFVLMIIESQTKLNLNKPKRQSVNFKKFHNLCDKVYIGPKVIKKQNNQIKHSLFPICFYEMIISQIWQ